MTETVNRPRMRISDGNGTTHVVTVRNPDLVQWDMTRAKHAWPAMTDAPFLWQSFVAWRAARRTGVIPESVKWDDFRDTFDVDVLDDPDPADPTNADPGPG